MFPQICALYVVLGNADPIAFSYSYSCLLYTSKNLFALDVALNEIHPDAVKLEEKKKEAAGYHRPGCRLYFTKPLFSLRELFKACTNGISELMTNISMSLVDVYKRQCLCS